MAKKQWIGADTFPTIWIWICVLFNLVGILAITMLIIAEVIIIVNDLTNYVKQYGHAYPARHYVGEDGCGYVGWTNAPKHLGSAVWMILFQLSIVVFATMVIASDLAWRKASYNEFGGHYVAMFYANGIVAGEHNKGLFYFVIANGFLKVFLVILYMSQSFYGLKGGSHSPLDLERVNGGGFDLGGGGRGGGIITKTITTAAYTAMATTTTVVVQTAQPTGTVITGFNGGTISTRNLVARIGPTDDPGSAYGTELWAQWAGWIVLGSVVPSIIAFMFLVPWAAKKNEEQKGSDKEKGKS